MTTKLTRVCPATSLTSREPEDTKMGSPESGLFFEDGSGEIPEQALARLQQQ